MKCEHLHLFFQWLTWNKWLLVDIFDRHEKLTFLLLLFKCWSTNQRQDPIKNMCIKEKRLIIGLLSRENGKIGFYGWLLTLFIAKETITSVFFPPPYSQSPSHSLVHILSQLVPPIMWNIKASVFLILFCGKRSKQPEKLSF